MIKHISSSSKHLSISNWGGATVNAYPSMPSTGAVGMMRWNPTSNGIEVWDGNAWANVTGATEVNLNRDTEELLDWAMKQKTRMERLERLATENVTIRDALENYTRAAEALDILETLCEKVEQSQCST